MQANYQNFDKYQEIPQNKAIQTPVVWRMKVYLFLWPQLIYTSGLVSLMIYSVLSYYILYDRLIFDILFPITILITVATQSFLLHRTMQLQINKQFIKPFVGAFFLIVNCFFVNYFWFAVSDIYPYRFYYYYHIFQPYVFLGQIGLLLIIFIMFPQAWQKQRWISVLVIPTIINFILVFFHFYLDFNITVWLYLFSIACLYMTEQDYNMGGEFFLSINIFGFITYFRIKAAVYIFNTFKNQSSQFVAQLQEQKQAQFIFWTYIIAAISTLLTPLFNKIFIFHDPGFFCEYSYYNDYDSTISPGFWIILAFNYFFYILLLSAHRYLEFKYKTILALIYLAFHQLSVTGLYFLIQCGRNYYNVYILAFYYYIMFLKIQFLVGAITLQIKQQLCLKSLSHVILLVPIFYNFSLVLYSYIQVSDVLLIIIVNTFLIVYLGQLLPQDSNFFLQFKEDEYLISGALFSDPLALFICQSIFVHVKIFKP